jgi:hypothetical protein
VKLSDLDRVAALPGVQPIADALQWLDTLTKSPRVTWEAGQLAAARAALLTARELMGADVLALARGVYPNTEPVQAPAARSCRLEGLDGPDTSCAVFCGDGRCQPQRPELQTFARQLAGRSIAHDIVASVIGTATTNKACSSCQRSDGGHDANCATGKATPADLDAEAEAFVDERWAAADAYLAAEWPYANAEARAVARDIFTNVIAEPGK